MTVTVLPAIAALSDDALAAYPVPLRRYGEHTAEEQSVIVERIRRKDTRDCRELAERGFPVGSRVQIAEAYRRHLSEGHFAGRTGVILRPCMGVEYVYVRLDPTSRELTMKERVIALKDLEPAPTASPMIGHNGGPALDDDHSSSGVIRVVAPSGTSIREIARRLSDTADVRAEATAGGHTITRWADGRAWSTLAYVSNASTDEAALAAFRARIAASRIDAVLPRVQTMIGPRFRGSCSVTIIIDDDSRSTALPFAGHCGYADSKRAAAELAKEQRRTAAAALIAYEAEHGLWLPKVEADAAAGRMSEEQWARAIAAYRIRIALTKPWDGKGMPTPAALIRHLDLEDAAQAPQTASRRPPRRVLILPCSATKRPDAAPLPAQERYTGPLWQSYRVAVAQLPSSPKTLVLSAEFGIIGVADPIPDYDRMLDEDRAAEIAASPAQLDSLAAALDGATDLYVTGGALYRATVGVMVRTLRDAGRLPADLAVIATDGLGIGQQRAALHAWLEQCAAPIHAEGERIEAQRRTAAGMIWQGCTVLSVSRHGYQVRFDDGVELPRPPHSVRPVTEAA